MNFSKRTASALLAGAILAASLSAPAAPPKLSPRKASISPAVLAHGKSLAAQYGCANCHGATLAGRKGFAPSLHASGVLKEYTAAAFVRVMDTGVMPEGGIVHKPMPVYHLKTKDSRPLYAYLKSLK